MSALCFLSTLLLETADALTNSEPRFLWEEKYASSSLPPPPVLARILATVRFRVGSAFPLVFRNGNPTDAAPTPIDLTSLIDWNNLLAQNNKSKTQTGGVVAAFRVDGTGRAIHAGIALPPHTRCDASIALFSLFFRALQCDPAACARVAASCGLCVAHGVSEAVSGATVADPGSDPLPEQVLAAVADRRDSRVVSLCALSSRGDPDLAAWLAVRRVSRTFLAGRVFGMRRTKGSQIEALPPPAASLCRSFLACHTCARRAKGGSSQASASSSSSSATTTTTKAKAKSASSSSPPFTWPPTDDWIAQQARCGECDGRETLTVGARALAKHAVRDGSESFWGAPPRGPVAAQNRRAVALLRGLLERCEWHNTHRLPGAVAVFEVRVPEGFGARWAADGSQFRGFLEPPMANGWQVRWRHD